MGPFRTILSLTALSTALLAPGAVAGVPDLSWLPPSAQNALEHAGNCSYAAETCSAAACIGFAAAEETTEEAGVAQWDGYDCTFERRDLDPEPGEDLDWVLDLIRFW